MTKSQDNFAVEDIFTPGQFPKYTYNSRKEVENQFTEWYKSRGSILVINGPSKTGKTVLLERLIEDKNPIWVDGGGIVSVSVFWDRVTDALGGFSEVERITGDSLAIRGSMKTSVNPVVFTAEGTASSEYAQENAQNYAVTRPKESVVRDALKLIDRPLIIDDIHFVGSEVQKDIVKAVKPLVFGTGTEDKKGRRVIFVSIGNRVQNVISTLPDMRGRMQPLKMQFWDIADLCRIASDGFQQLRIDDPRQEIAKELATNSFGSPQLMQQLCLAICRNQNNDIQKTSKRNFALKAPDDWRSFYRSQLMEEMGQWVDKLAEGPSVRGMDRKERKLRGSEKKVDGYKLSLLAMARTGPKLTISKNELRDAINLLCEEPPGGEKISTPTTILKNMSLIAATKLEDKIPPMETLRQKRESGYDPYGDPDLEPVLEYVDRGGALSEIRITEPFFAYYLAWGKERVIASSEAPATTCEDDDWGE